MEILNIKLENKISKIFIGEKLENLNKYLPLNKKIFIITDINVNCYYADIFPESEKFVMGTGEENKTLKTAEKIYEWLIEYEADRSSFIVGIGGGIVCDVTGFVASTYMRGLKFGFVSTTLLSQVDASIGGKNGVNLHGYKNMIGVFNQPEFVICDFSLLKTLPEEEFRTGFAEIIKHACIRNTEMFDFIEKNFDKALKNDYNTIYRLVYDSLIIKGKVVENDEKETGERRILNFGHTFGHAIEKISGLSHGEAISIGMVIATKLSENKGYLSQSESNRIINLLKTFKLPVKTNIDMAEIIDALKKDKKREADEINFVLLKSIGNAIIEKIKISELEKIKI
jgi:3-dehydroquinate synthase